MRVQVDEADGVLVCHLIGNLEHLAVGEFREAVAQISGAKRVIFELSAVPFVDSAGLGALIGAIRRARELRGEAVVSSARPSVKRVLEIVGLPRIVNIFDEVGQALAYFSRQEVA